MVSLWRCEICGDGYVGTEPPANCPFCGAHKENIKLYKDAKAVFDIPLTDKDRENAQKALSLELSNAAFYLCASRKVEDKEGQGLFKALSKIESEHASIWRKILKLDKLSPAEDSCSEDYKDDLEESHRREERAISFYRKAGEESDEPRMKQIFQALVLIEGDHLLLSEERLR